MSNHENNGNSYHNLIECNAINTLTRHMSKHWDIYIVGEYDLDPEKFILNIPITSSMIYRYYAYTQSCKL